ncbi:Rap1a/Tai family immunity protein, partial [Paraburkholderia tropica]
PRYCLPPTATRPQQLGAVLAYMKGHLENMLEPTGAVVYKALIAAYPCQAKR